MKRIILSLLVVVFAVSAGFSQQYGHLNFGNLLSLMPGTAAAQTELENFQKAEVAKLEKLAEQLQADYRKVEADVENYTPIQLQDFEAKFQQRQQDIAAKEQQLSVNIEQKRNELLGPLIEQARAAIDEVAKEKGYNMVFDSSLFNALLFTEEATDLMPAVKAKLGIE